MLYRSVYSELPYARAVHRARTARAEAMAVWTSRAARRLARVARSFVASWAEARRRGAAIRELRRMDERMLKDIGIDRHQIRTMVESGREPAPHHRERPRLKVIANSEAEPQIRDGERRAAA